MKKTLSILSCVTILSACGTDNNDLVSGKHSPELNNAVQQVPQPPQSRNFAPQATAPVKSYAATPYLGNGLVPPAPPVTIARPVPTPIPTVSPSMMASNNIGQSGRRAPEANRNAAGLGSADLLGPAPSPVVRSVPLSSQTAVMPTNAAVAPSAQLVPLQKIQSVASAMPQGSVIPKAPAKNAKPQFDIPTRVAEAKVAPLPVPSANIHDVAVLPSVSRDMPQGVTVPNAPARTSAQLIEPPAPRADIHDVAPLPAVATNMPQGTVFPPVPAVKEPEVHDVAPIAATADSMPKRFIFPSAPPVGAKLAPVEAPTQMSAQGDSLPPLDKTQIVVSADPLATPAPAVASAPMFPPAKKAPAAKNVSMETPPAPRVAAAAVPALPVPTAPKLVAQANDDNLKAPAPVANIEAPKELKKPTTPMNIANNNIVDIHENTYDEYPNLADIPPAPPKPTPAAADARVVEMKQDLKNMQNSAPDNKPQPAIVKDEPAPKPAPVIASIPAPAPEPVKAAAPTPAPQVAQEPPVTPGKIRQYLPPEPLMPKGPTIVVKDDSSSSNDAPRETKKAEDEIPPLPVPTPAVAPAPLAPMAASAVAPAPAVIVAPAPVAAAAPAPVANNSSGPGKPAGFLVPPTFVNKPAVQQTIHEGVSTNAAADNNFENVQPISIDHSGFLPESRYSKSETN